MASSSGRKPPASGCGSSTLSAPTRTPRSTPGGLAFSPRRNVAQPGESAALGWQRPRVRISPFRPCRRLLMLALVSVAARRAVAPEATGSIPARQPIPLTCSSIGRAPDSGSGGSRFESWRVNQPLLWSNGRTRGFGPRHPGSNPGGRSIRLARSTAGRPAEDREIVVRFHGQAPVQLSHWEVAER